MREAIKIEFEPHKKYSVKDLAILNKCSKNTILKKIKQGLIPAKCIKAPKYGQPKKKITGIEEGVAYSKAAFSRHTGLSRPTINAMIEDGRLIEAVKDGRTFVKKPKL